MTDEIVCCAWCNKPIDDIHDVNALAFLSEKGETLCLECYNYTEAVESYIHNDIFDDPTVGIDILDDRYEPYASKQDYIEAILKDNPFIDIDTL